VSDARKTKTQLIEELAALRERVASLEHVRASPGPGTSQQPTSNEQTALQNMALLLSAQLDVDVLLKLIAEQAVTLLGVTAGGLYRYDERRNRLVLVVGLDVYSEHLGTELDPGEGLAGRAFQRREVKSLDDYHDWDGRTDVSGRAEPLRSVIAAPLPGKHTPLGVLFVADGRRQHFTQHDTKLVELLAAQAAIALENAQLHERMQEQYRRMQDAQSRLIYSEKMAALGRLIASISHEINNPLQAIQGCLTLVCEGISENSEAGNDTAASWLADLAMASSEVQRIAAIVQRLRDFYRPTRIGLQQTQVAAVLDAVLALTAKQMQHSNIAIDRVVLDEAPATIMTNADLVKQVILNLVLNAIDAMPQGGRLRIATAPGALGSGDEAQAAVRIEFADTGYGIPAENLARIFEPFFSTKDTGTGLGLSISYDLIKSLGGDISVVSEAGMGTTFTISLPVEPRKPEGQP
jgi:two-component system NtrC family sensor kinase